MKDTKLFLGCGPSPIHAQHLEYIDDLWVKIDKYVDEPGIVKMDIRKLEYPDESVDEIYCSHTLEHIGLKEVVPTLREWNRVLVPGGKLTINVPDMEWAAYQLIQPKLLDITTMDEYPNSNLFDTPEMLMEVIYGNQDHEGEYHKSGFTKGTLNDYLVSAGFVNIQIKQKFEAHEMGCLIAKATR